MKYYVLMSYNDGDITSKTFDEYDAALMYFYGTFVANIEKYNGALGMIIDRFGNTLKTERYEKEVRGEVTVDNAETTEA